MGNNEIIRVLLIEDDIVDQMAFRRFVRNEKMPYDYTVAGSVAEAKEILDSGSQFDIVLTDFFLGDGTAFDLLDIITFPTVVITGTGGEEIAVRAMKSGASDYLRKDINRDYLKVLPATVANVIKHAATSKLNKMLSYAIQNLKDSVYITDLDGKISFVNGNFCSTYGYSDREIVGKSIEILNSTGPSSDRPEKDIYMHQRKNGGEFPVSLSKSALAGRHGNDSFVVQIARDVSDWIETQEELKEAKQSADQANRAKSQFLAYMSHEIRTPINGLMGMMQMALDSDLNPQQESLIKTAADEAETLLSLLNDILDLSKIEAGKLELEDKKFELRKLLKSVEKSIRVRTDEKDLSFSLKISEDVPATLLGDEVRLRQILMNLLSNAVKFTEKGSIALDVSLEVARGDLCIVNFAVSDTGIGIPKDRKELVFQAFAQADSSTTREFGGTGLGLFISMQLCHLMGGQLTLESEVGEGSTFSFTVKLSRWTEASGDEKDEKATVETPELRRSLKVLVVEDNPTNQRITKYILEKIGHRCEVVEDGKKAVDRFSPGEFDLILMDCQMPIMDGFEATMEIRNQEVGTQLHVPIVALTADATAGDRDRCLDAGMDDYLSKPFTKSQLVEIISKRLK